MWNVRMEMIGCRVLTCRNVEVAGVKCRGSDKTGENVRMMT